MGDNFYKYNDYELLYYANQNNEEAIELILWKYSFLVKSRLKSLKVPYHLWDDYLQEANIVIYKAIKSYDSNSKLSFTNYVDMVVKSRIITLLRKDLKQINVDIDYLDTLQEEEKSDLTFSLNDDEYNFSEREKLIFNLCFIEGKKVKEVSIITGIDCKKISDTKQRILKKMKKALND